MKRLLLGLLLTTSFSSAFAQQIIPPNGSASFPPNTSLNLGTGTLTAASATLGNGSSPAAAVATLNGGLAATITVDPGTLSSPAQPWTFTANLAPAVTSTSIYGTFEAQSFLSGPAAQGAEWNIIHSYGQINAGGSATSLVENLESNLNNYGSVSGNYTNINDFLVNQSTGTITGPAGASLLSLAYTNNNTAAGAISNLTYMQIAAPTLGSGASAPTNTYGIVIKDPAAAIVTLGEVNIGSVGLPQAGQWLTVTAADASQNNYTLELNNNSWSTLIANDAGDFLINTFHALPSASAYGYLYIPHGTATPTTVCAYSGSGPCLYFNDTTLTLDIGSAGGWRHIATVSGAG